METGPAEFRHAIRGTLNALKLCVSAFDMPLEASDKLEFLSDIEASADKLVSLLDEFEAHAPNVAADTAPVPSSTKPTALSPFSPIATIKPGS